MNTFTAVLAQIIVFLQKEAPKIVIILGVAGFLVWAGGWFPGLTGHPEFAPLITCVYMILFLLVFVHFVHRVLFTKLDIQTIALDAVQNKNLPAAVVFASVCSVIISLMFVFSLMLR